MSEETVETVPAETGDKLSVTGTPLEHGIDELSSVNVRLDKIETRMDRLASKEMLEVAIKNTETNFAVLQQSLSDAREILRVEFRIVEKNIGFFDKQFDEKFADFKSDMGLAMGFLATLIIGLFIKSFF
ncbi:MAG: hypothetical protein LBQ79_14955 [Deltaproteobacteria bacterium]|nr:hypothetical protein [Deltaproteobacteria bacterium]